MMYHDEKIRDNNTVVCDNWSDAYALMKTLWNISHEPNALGEYAICVTDEDGSIRVDFKFVPYGDDSVVFCAESELYEMMESAVQDADQDTVQDVAYSQGEFDG